MSIKIVYFTEESPMILVQLVNLEF